MKRVGLFSGTFDPVHKGHIEACVVAKAACQLDEVLLMIEQKPRRKRNVAGYEQRKAMLELAISKYPSLKVVDRKEPNITTKNTLAYLNDTYPEALYSYIVGDDLLGYMLEWPQVELLFENMELCVFLRDNKNPQQAEQVIRKIQGTYKQAKITLLPAVWSPLSSSSVKQELHASQASYGLDTKVLDYIKEHGLYAK